MPRDQYTQDEKRDMLEVYITQNRNARRAAAEYGQRYPHRRPPSHMAFHRVYRRFQGTGSKVQPLHHIREGDRVRTFDVELDVLLYTHENPTSSLRQASSVLGISKETIRRIRVAYNMYPYRPHIVHGLHRGDQQRRLGFLAVIDCLLMDVPDLLENILWTDESRFTNNGMYNRWNFRHWAETNPRLTFTSHHQVSYSVNVWCGILNSRIIGP